MLFNFDTNLFQDLMAKVIKDTPEDPVGYLIKVLKKVYSEGGSKVTFILFCQNNNIIMFLPLEHRSP